MRNRSRRFPVMFVVLGLVFALGAGALFWAAGATLITPLARGGGIDPNGRPGLGGIGVDAGCHIDPNGCAPTARGGGIDPNGNPLRLGDGDAGGAMDPNGRPQRQADDAGMRIDGNGGPRQGVNTGDQGSGIDPNGGRRQADGDGGGAMDPNGGRVGAGPRMDDNGGGRQGASVRIDPDGSPRQAYGARIDGNGAPQRVSFGSVINPDG